MDIDRSLLVTPFDNQDEGPKMAPTPPVGLPAGWKFVVDSNEMAGNHKGYLIPGSVTRKIQGPFDYTIESPEGGLDDRVGVERKSLPNILLEVGAGRTRWEKSLEKMANIEFPCVVIETGFARIRRGGYRKTKISPNSVVGSILTWSLRYRVPIWMTETRVQGALLTQWWLAKAAREIQEKTRATGQGGAG